MMAMLKIFFKRLLPAAWVSQYHKQLARLAAWRHHYPAEQLIVIGVTGTKGKSTTSNLLWHLLTAAGYTVGMATTANFRIGETHWLNASKMTMLGRTQLQDLLAQMVQAHCQYAIVETSSEGIKQWRHLGIHYDVVVWTNLFPEHLDAHGGFENYKAAKLSLFDHLVQSPTKVVNGQRIPKAAVLNGDSEYYPEFAENAVTPVKIVWSQCGNSNAHVQITDLAERTDGLDFQLAGYQFSSQLLGAWSIENIASAIGVGLTQGLSYPQLAEGLKTFAGAPGRMELITAGQNFTVVVDYAYEPVSLELLYSFWRKLRPNNKLITLISSTGGGRDLSRRFANGKVAGRLCDYVIVTDEDPYDDDPQLIIDQVAEGVTAAGKQLDLNVWKLPDRRVAMATAFRLAQLGDVVFLTCKGVDQKICRAKGKKEPWDDRTVAREELIKIV
jgi:UDP-N-acetylmuramoyl-L-alanyl-D-glutamate--2,6-diaminopimelate ligase